jgi:hypothetical protein
MRGVVTGVEDTIGFLRGFVGLIREPVVILTHRRWSNGRVVGERVGLQPRVEGDLIVRAKAVFEVLLELGSVVIVRL